MCPSWENALTPHRSLESPSDVLYFAILPSSDTGTHCGGCCPYDDGTQWEAGALHAPASSSGGGASAIDDLSDVDTATAGPAVGDVLEWDGTNWTPATPSSGGGGGSMAYLQANYDTASLASTFETSTYSVPDFDETNKISSNDETLNASEQYEVPATGLYRLTFLGSWRERRGPIRSVRAVRCQRHSGRYGVQ